MIKAIYRFRTSLRILRNVRRNSKPQRMVPCRAVLPRDTTLPLPQEGPVRFLAVSPDWDRLFFLRRRTADIGGMKIPGPLPLTTPRLYASSRASSRSGRVVRYHAA